jgi:hypothetical protein
MTTLLIAVLFTGWVSASILGTQAYFRGEQTKPIHDRNLKSQSFDQLAQTFTGKETDHASRIISLGLDTYTSNNLPNA